MEEPSTGIGRRIAPPRFILFVLLLIAGASIGSWLLDLRHGLMAGFDVAASVFLASVVPLILRSDPATMRVHAARNDANRPFLLVVTAAVLAVILVTVGAELADSKSAGPGTRSLVIATLTLAWLFANAVYAFHYAHLYYRRDGESGDRGGIDFPGTPEPVYSDFVYFAFTLGMTFQTSDSNVTATHMRRVVVWHCFAGFVYNIGVLAFTINVLGGWRS